MRAVPGGDDPTARRRDDVRTLRRFLLRRGGRIDGVRALSRGVSVRADGVGGGDATDASGRQAVGRRGRGGESKRVHSQRDDVVVRAGPARRVFQRAHVDASLDRARHVSRDVSVHVSRRSRALAAAETTAQVRRRRQLLRGYDPRGRGPGSSWVRSANGEGGRRGRLRGDQSRKLGRRAARHRAHSRARSRSGRDAAREGCGARHLRGVGAREGVDASRAERASKAAVQQHARRGTRARGRARESRRRIRTSDSPRSHPRGGASESRQRSHASG